MKILSIQWVRFFAAYGVVLYHTASRFWAPFTIGQAGVDIFFVISGFVMWTVTERPVTPARFITDRLIRMAPMYWLATGIMVAGGLLHMFPHLILTWQHVVASLLFVPWHSPSDGRLWPVLVPGWTLNYEMMFYTLIALSQFLPRRSQLPTLLTFFIVVVAAGQWLRATSDIIRFYSDPIILEFCFGLVLGWLSVQKRLPGARWSGLFVAFGILAFIAQVIFDATGPRLLFYGLPALSIVLGLAGLERSGADFRFKPLVFAGDGSYSIYLFHTLALSVLLKLVPASLGFWAILPVSAAAVGVGLFAYHFIEGPMLRWLRTERRRLAPAPVIAF